MNPDIVLEECLPLVLQTADGELCQTNRNIQVEKNNDGPLQEAHHDQDPLADKESSHVDMPKHERQKVGDIGVKYLLGCLKRVEPVPTAKLILAIALLHDFLINNAPNLVHVFPNRDLLRALTNCRQIDVDSVLRQAVRSVAEPLFDLKPVSDQTNNDDRPQKVQHKFSWFRFQESAHSPKHKKNKRHDEGEGLQLTLDILHSRKDLLQVQIDGGSVDSSQQKHRSAILTIESFGSRFVAFAHFLLPFLVNAVAEASVASAPHHFDWQRVVLASSGPPYLSARSCPEYWIRWRVVYPLVSALRSANQPNSIVARCSAFPAAEPPANDWPARSPY